MSVIPVFAQISKIGACSISNIVDTEHIHLQAIGDALSKVDTF